MKKIGILGVIAMAITMFLFTNNVYTTNSDHSLADLIDMNVNMNTANAESGDNSGDPMWTVRDVSMRCGAISWTKTEYFNSAGALLGTLLIEGGVIKSSYSGGWAYTVQTTGTSGGVTMTGRDCPSGWWFCSVYNPCKDL